MLAQSFARGSTSYGSALGDNTEGASDTLWTYHENSWLSRFSSCSGVRQILGNPENSGEHSIGRNFFRTVLDLCHTFIQALLPEGVAPSAFDAVSQRQNVLAPRTLQCISDFFSGSLTSYLFPEHLSERRSSWLENRGMNGLPRCITPGKRWSYDGKWCLEGLKRRGVFCWNVVAEPQQFSKGARRMEENTPIGFVKPETISDP